MNDLQKAIEAKILGIINPPKDQVKRPHNRLWIALIAFNLIFFPLDVATGITVGMSTHWFYGLWVFGSGFGTMVIHEALFSNPYAKIWQKGISVFGFIVSVGITILIGVSAIAVSMEIIPVAPNMAGAAMAIVAFIALFGHGILIAIYYFSDAGFLAKMRTTSALADSDRMVTEMAMAQVLVTAVNKLRDELTSTVNKGDGAAMGAALNKITGDEWNDLGALQQTRSFASTAQKVELDPKVQGQNGPKPQNPQI